MKNLSLTGRLIAVVVVCQLALTAALTITAVVYARKELSASFDAALQSRATGILALVRYTESNPPGLLFDRSMLPPSSDKNHQDVFEIREEDGSLVVQSGLPGDVSGNVAQADGSFSNFALQGMPYRAVSLKDVPVLDDEESVKMPSRVTVLYAASLVGMNHQLAHLAVYVAGTSLLLLFAASVVATWGIRRGLQPLRDLAARAEAVSVHNWDLHLPEDREIASELAPLAGAITRVLERLQESFRQQRDFTSDAAHELKTSVAILKSTLQSLLQKPRAGQEYRSGLEGSLEDCERLEDLLERMLRLARIEQRTEANTPPAVGVTDLTSTCETAIARIQRMADARDVKLELVASAGAQLRADPKDLELIWVNLLENAVQYSPAGAVVVLRARTLTSSTVLVSVEDSGPGVSPSELPHIFERFRRGDPSRARSTGGFGLGLAICKALVEACGGGIEAVNRHGGGAEIRVQLPAESQTPDTRGAS